MHKDPNLSRKIWEGKPEAIAEARKRYEADQEGQLVPWISTLYSFRSMPECRYELRNLLVMHDFFNMAKFGAFTADQLDVLSTILVWFAHDRERLIGGRAWRVRKAAARMLKKALEMTKYELAGCHTRSLLALTNALLLVEAGDKHAARVMLGIAEARGDVIRDPNQKARVYRKLGALYLKLWNPVGLCFIARACFVKGAARGVRMKTLFFWRQ